MNAIAEAISSPLPFRIAPQKITIGVTAAARPSSEIGPRFGSQSANVAAARNARNTSALAIRPQRSAAAGSSPARMAAAGRR